MTITPRKWCRPMAVLAITFLLYLPAAMAQGQKRVTLSSGNQTISLAEIFKALKQQTGFTVFYNNQVLNDREKLKVNFNGAELSAVMDFVLKDRNVSWRFNDQYIILSKQAAAPAEQAPVPAKKQGRVTDETGQPLFRATVRVKNAAMVALTDTTGRFSIAVPDENARLLIGFVGFAGKEVPVKGRDFLNISLEQENSGLNEVIVIGYGTTTRKDLTGAVGTANVEDMQKAPVPSFDQALAGRIAGVDVSSADGQPGAAARISVRGNSITQDGTPLFVVDGFPIENMDINSINPTDIESLEVLKDASSIAIYGARGANGVIIINTKRGKAGPPRLTYNFSMGFQEYVKKMEMLSPYEFVKLQLEIDSIRSTPANPVTTYRDVYLSDDKGITLESYKNMPGYNWQDLVMRTGSTQNHSINLMGGNADTRYSVNGSYFNQQGVIVNTGLKRLDGKFTLDQRFNKNIRGGLTAGYSNTASYGTIPTAGFSGGVVQGMWQYRPVTGVGNQDLLNSLIDSLALEEFNSGNATAQLGNNLINPLLQAQNEFRKNTNNTGTINAFLEFSFLKNFRFRMSGGVNSTLVRSEAFYNSKTQQGNVFKNPAGAIANANGINGGVNHQQNMNYLSENILSYKNTFNKTHKLDALAGFTYQRASTNGTGYKSINIPESTEYLGMLSLNTGTPSNILTLSSRWQLYSFLARVNYGFNDKYFVTLSGRADGSSKFIKGRQWGYFPSGAVAWMFTQEPWLQGIRKVLSDGKIRLSYGSVGNNKVGDFSYLSTLAGGNGWGYPFANSYMRGVIPFGSGNPNLTWETTREFDAGVNLSFFKDRLALDADYYSRTTEDFLLNVQVPFMAGYTSNSLTLQYQNTGAVRNRGFELTINTLNIKRKNFSWNTNFNISFNKSIILRFYNGLDVMQTGLNLPGGNNTTAWVAKRGSSISQFYGYKWGGVYQYDDFDKLANNTYVLKNGVPTYSSNVQPGDPRYQDINGDGVINDNDQTMLGSPLPIHTGGFSNNFNYKNFSLNIFFHWNYGNKILNANRMAFASTGGFFNNGNQFAEYANRWRPDNPSNEIPRAKYNTRGDASSPVPKVNSRYIEDGSFLRLKTVALGYSVPPHLLRPLRIRDIKVYAAAQNLLTFTNYSGIDPEVSTFRVQNPANAPGGGTVGGAVTSGTGYTFVQGSSSYTALSGGLDWTAYPRAFTISFGLTATF